MPEAETISFDDDIQGRVDQQLLRDVGDFVVRRADGPFAYQFAVVVDDNEQQISHVVRGADLLSSTPRQIYLQQLLGYSRPSYAHLPVAVDANGEKLSKQTLATPVDSTQPLPALIAAWHFLGQVPLDMPSGIGEFWTSAPGQWRLNRVPRLSTLRASDYSR